MPFGASVAPEYPSGHYQTDRVIIVQVPDSVPPEDSHPGCLSVSLLHTGHSKARDKRTFV